MTKINRKAGAIWEGDLKNGKGKISTESQTLLEKKYSYETRFVGENSSGANPEELIAAAHAACYSMALANTLKKNGFEPKQTETTATCTLTSQNGGFAITDMYLHVRADVPDIEEDRFQEIVKESDKGCPVSNLLRDGLEIEIEADLM